jgi:hypothetical protein
MSDLKREEAIGAAAQRLQFIVELEPGSRGAYRKFIEAQRHAREALTRLRDAGIDPTSWSGE